MVAVYTGTGLGLFNTSITALGGASGGTAGLGQLRGGQYVNAATGNLVLQNLDESLLVRGLSASFQRTYNSRGTVAGAGQDGWVTGFERSVALTTGTLNVAGSKMTLYTGDGQAQVFTYVSDNTYQSTDGEGAHDTLVWNAGSLTWTCTEGRTRREEQYANHADATLKGRLTRVRDLRSDGTTPAEFDIIYDAYNRISEVRSIDGTGTSADAIVFGYNGTTTQLTSVSTREGGQLLSQVFYQYDGYGRLASVLTDLTPDQSADNTWNTTASANDGKLFKTTYAYVTASASDLRIASVSTSDGVTVAYTYESDGASGYRISKVTQGNAGDGSSQTMTFTYGAGSTDVTDDAGRIWTYQYDANKRLTAVLEPPVNGQRQITTYSYDTSDNLVRVSVAGDSQNTTTTTQLDTVYTYDANGNRTLQRDRLGNTVTWTYNSANQVATETRYTVADADGVDPDHTGGTNQPGGALTTTYVYDTQNRLRFVVNAAGEVREIAYATSGNGIGQAVSERRYTGATYSGTIDESSLNAWATNATAMRRADSELTTYEYDAKGRLSQTVRYASVGNDVNGNGVFDAATSLTTFVYDGQGLLRQQITVHGTTRALGGTPPDTSAVVNYVYDGMGRLTDVIRRSYATSAAPDRNNPANATAYANWVAANDAATVLTTYVYVDSSNQIRVTSDTGMVRTEARNAAGQIVSFSEANAATGATVTRTTQYFYDNTGRLRASQDASGARTYFFYDEVGRLSATVDGTGAVTRTVYDNVGRVVQTIGYATRVDTTAWMSGDVVVKTALVYATTSPALTGGQAWVPTDTAHDRTTQKTYDNAGRLATETVVGADNSQTLKTTYAYDAADRLLQVSVTDGAGTAATARTTRYLYDSTGRVGAMIDAKGYVTETLYDLAGRVAKTVRYATVLANPNVADLATLKATLATLATSDDLATRHLYDGLGREVGMVDAEGYFTESIYDEASNQRAVKAYAKKLSGLAGTESLSTLRTLATTGAPTEAYRLTQRTFNALGQLQTELNAEGTVTRYSYDEAGRLVRTESGYGTTEVREDNLRYDVFGNVIGEISGENVIKAMQALTGGKALNDTTLSSATLDAVYAQYGVRHDYDLLGRRIESIDAQGNKTWTFYDNAGHPTFVVRGVKDGAGLQNGAGEVTETRYGAFGEVTDVIAYTGRITIATPGSRASVQSAIVTLTAIGNTDSRLQLRYDQRGLLTERIDAEGYRTTYGYNAFGEEALVQDWTSANALQRSQGRSYDVRGQLTGITDAAGALTRSQGWTYDAFGRMATATDARGTLTQYAYDRRGRQVQVTQVIGVGRSESVSTTYDAFDRVLTTTDARGATTSWVYSDTDRSIIMTTPEGLAITTKFNRFGQTIEVRQPLPGGGTAVSSTAYDHDGHVVTQTDALGNVLTNEYDTRGLLAATIDATGRRVEYTYDAAGRVLTRTEDPGSGKLNLVTTTVYDGQGRQIRVTDASGRVTTMAYDRNGQLTEVVRDPSGLALKTTYTWDRGGRQLSVTEGANTANATTTSYAYDGYGRRTSETVAPGTLALTTTYVYDANDNVVSKTDASGRVTRYAYDAADRLRFVLDGAGDVAETAYDLNGRVTMTRRYAKALNTATLGVTPSEADITTALQSQSLANDALDVAEYRVYDTNGRERFRIDGAGDVVEQVYDAGGRVARQTRYVNRIALGTTLRNALVAGAAPASVSVTANAADESTRYVYDAAGRTRYTIEANGAYRAVWYDAAGRIAVTRSMIKPLNPASISDGMTVAQIDAMNQWGATDDLDMFVYDGAGRLRYALQTVGDPTVFPFTAAVTETRYDGADRVLLTRSFADLMTLDTALITKLGAGTAAEADFATFTTASATTAQSERRVYDTAGRQVFVIDATGGVSATWYDQAGRVSVTRTLVAKLSTAGLSDATTSAQVSAQLVWGATDDLRMYVYDAAGRQRFALRGAGDITVFPFTASVAETTYDGAGRVLNTRAFADLMSLDATLIEKLGAGTAVEADFATFTAVHAGNVQGMRRVYDAAGRQVYAIDGTGAFVRTTHDGMGRVIVSRSAAARLATAGLSDATTVTQLDALAVWSATDDLRMSIYDAAGNERFVLRSVGDSTAASFAASVSERRTDGAGRTLLTRAFVPTMTLDAALIAKLGAGTATEADLASFASANATNAQSERRVYDAAGRAVYTIDAAGAYARTWYDGMGRVVAVRRFDAAFATANISDTSTVGQLDGLLDWNAAARMEYRVYDAADQLRVVYDTTGMITRMDYDGAGRLVMTHRYASVFSTSDGTLGGRLFAGTATLADFATFTAANEATARATAQVYDAAGQLRFSLDRDGSQWFVGERQYDGLGRTTAELRYGFGIAYTQGQVEANVIAAVQAQLSTDPQIQATQYRATRYLHDGANQVRYVTDATGAVSESRYDGVGRVVESRSYANRPTGVTFTTAGLDAWVQTQASADIRKLVNAYDAGGRLLSRTDALNHTESFAYDGAGRMTSRTDRAGAVWTYQYDGAGRRVAEISPQVQVNTVDGYGALTSVTRSVVTRYAYDALGQLVTKTENADTSDTRVTQYTYDTRGHLTRTTLPDPGAVDPTTGAIVYAGNPPTVDTTYDLLGRAVVVKDAAGQYTYRVYDGLDRVVAEVDPLLNVSTYAYNAYGEQTSTVRFAAVLNTATSAFTSAGWSAGKAMTVAEITAGTNAADAANRTITTEYDGLGRKSKVLLSSVSYYKAAGTLATGQPTTTFAYNAYGETVRESVLLEGTAGQADAVWADTWRFYDAAGRNTLTVDAEGYVTRTDYNATGDATKVVEYARAVSTTGVNATTPPTLPVAGDATTGYDRETRWTYDALGRKASETVVHMLRTTSGGVQSADAVTVYGYDNEDRATTVTDASGTVTTTYDALGHVVAVQEQARNVLASNAGTLLQQSNANTLASTGLYVQRSPYTTMAYDAFGNVVGVRRYANGRDGSNAAVADDTRDQISVTRYLKSGQAAMSRDPLGNLTYSTYDAAGRLVHAWSRLEGSEDVRDAMVHRWYTYDAAGRQTGSRILRTSLDGATLLGADQSEAVTWNAFGEIATKTYGEAGALLAGTLQYGYDAAGRMVSDNATGAARQFGYNLAGMQVRESHMTWIDTATGALDTVTWTKTDRLGRAVSVQLPSYTTSASDTALVRQAFDRWGNVVQVIDARGYQTDYQFDDRNQMVQETRPLVWVVNESGVGGWQRPVNAWYYDALGRLSGTRDANGNLTTYAYDAGGRMVSQTDALGNVTRHAYDALGNEALAQDAMGYITWKSFDQAGRVTSIGDYLASGTGRQSAVLQAYVLNQNGDRLRVTNALGQTQRYDYDTQQRLLRSETAMGVVGSYAYDVQGHKIRETNGLTGQTSMAAPSGTWTDRDGDVVQTNSLRWVYDAFGRVTDHNDLGGRDSNYVYDAASGMLKQETTAGGAYNYAAGDKTISYTRNGRVRKVEEVGGGTYLYEYDAAGNRVKEDVTAIDGDNKTFHLLTRTTYDSNNRVQRVVQDDVPTGKRIFDLIYDYDANGNRRRVVSQSGFGDNVSGITVTDSAPVVTAAPQDRGAKKGQTSTFRLLFSDVFRDAEGDALTLAISKSDGSALPSWLTASRDAQTGEIVFVANPAAGAADEDVVVKLTAYETSNSAQTVSTTFTVKVRSNNAPETLGPGAMTYYPKTGQVYGRDLLAGDFFRDIDVNDALTLSVIGTLPPGMTATANGGLVHLAGTPTTAGTYSITLRATDQAGATADKTITFVCAANAVPTATAQAATDATMNSTYLWQKTLPEVFTDPNGDTLQVTASGLPNWLSFQFQTSASPPKLVLNGVVPPTEQDNTTYNVVLTATDPSGASVSTTVQVRVTTNIAPEAPPVSNRNARQGAAFTEVLPAFFDINGDTLTISVTGLPPGLSFNTTTRTISGAPTTGGSWTVTYSANDGRVTTSTSFTIAVEANVAPVAPTIAAKSGVRNTPVYIVLPTFTDANNDTLAYSVSGLPTGMSFNAATHTITGRPTATGSWTVTYTANDGRGGVTSTTFGYTIAEPVGNQAPVVTNPLPDMLYDPSTGFSFQLASDAFTDPEGSTLTYTAKKSDGSNLPSWLTFNASTRTFSGTTPMLTDASWTIRVTTTDPSGASVYDDFVFSTSSGGGMQAMVYEMGLSQETLTQSYAQTASSPASVQVQDRWFTYDALNRIKISGGTLVAGAPGQNATIQLQPSTTSNEAFEVGYDAAGRQTVIYRQMTVGNQGIKTFATQTIFDARGNRIYLYHLQELGGANTGVQTAYTYDAANQVTESRSYFSVGAESWKAGPLDGEGYPLYTVNIGGMLSGRETFQYDADGRMVRQDTLGRPTGDTWWQNPTWAEGAPPAQYSDTSVLQLQARVDYTQGDGTSAWEDTDLSNNASKYDAAGRLTGYRYSALQDGNWFTHTFASSFEGWEGWSEKQVSGTSTNSNYKPTTNTLSYDRYGRLTKQQEHTEYQDNAIDDRVRVYASTGEGQVLNRREGTWKNSQFAEGDADSYGSKPLYRYVYANGQSMAELKDGGQVRAGMTLGIQSVAGMQAYEAGGGTVVPLAGDTLRTLAQRVYGSSSQWYVLADANGLSDPEATLTAGVQLKAPSTNVSKNDAGTFKPYNPNEAIGSTSPSLPYIQPPGSAGCSALATLIRIIAVVVVVALQQYELIPAAVAVGAGGEVLAQTVEINQGYRQGYNWGQVAVSAISAGWSGSSFVHTGNETFNFVANAAINSAINYAGSYAVNRLTHVEDHFSWRGLLAGAATAGITAGVFHGRGLANGQAASPPAAFDWKDVVRESMKEVAYSVVRQGIGHEVNKAFGIETSWNWRQVAAGALVDAAWAGARAWDWNGDGRANKNIKEDARAKTDLSKARYASDNSTVYVDGHAGLLNFNRYIDSPEGFVGAGPHSDLRYAWKEGGFVYDAAIDAYGNKKMTQEHFDALMSAHARGRDAYEEMAARGEDADQFGLSPEQSEGKLRSALGFPSDLERIEVVVKRRSMSAGNPRASHEMATAMAIESVGIPDVDPVGLTPPTLEVSGAIREAIESPSLLTRFLQWMDSKQDSPLMQALSPGMAIYNAARPIVNLSNYARWSVYTSTPLGQTGFGQRLMGDGPLQLPQWSWEGIVRNGAPGVLPWMDHGYQVSSNPLKMAGGYYMGVANTVSGTLNGLNSISLPGRLTYAVTGQRMVDLPMFDIQGDYEAGAAMWGVAQVALSFVAPQSRAGSVAGNVVRAEAGAARIAAEAEAAAGGRTLGSRVATSGDAYGTQLGGGTGAGFSDIPISPAGAPQKPLLLTHTPTTDSLSQIRRMRGPAKWQAGERYVQELYGSPAQRHYGVPAGIVDGEQIVGTGGRFVDAPVDLPGGGVFAGEVKTYQKWKTVNGLPEQQFVPLSKGIRQQVLKDIWLRENVSGYDPRWIFLDAPPSPELSGFLTEKGIVHVVHQ